MRRWMILGCAGLAMAAAAGAQGGSAERRGVEVSAHVRIDNGVASKTANKTADKMGMAKQSPANVVVWLTPLGPDKRPAATGHPGPFRLVQKNKMFTPHLLVVPTGSSVEFPNEDPFFHNVFSLFNGKRFDLGLYESGTSRAVRFDREGVSYIFCNIHPEMGAVVLALSTPYWGVSNANGEVEIAEVPPGNYRLHVWSETAETASPVEAERTVAVGSAAMRLDEIVLEAATDPMAHHKNKFGEEYKPEEGSRY